MTTGLAPGAPRPLQPLVFDCAGERLLGLLHPAGGRLGPGRCERNHCRGDKTGNQGAHSPV